MATTDLSVVEYRFKNESATDKKHIKRQVYFTGKGVCVRFLLLFWLNGVRITYRQYDFAGTDSVAHYGTVADCLQSEA